MHHSKYSYAKSLVENNEPILLIGPAGTGKTTIAMQIAEELSLPFHSISCTKQMSVSALLGFISINGAYIPTQLRHAYESGGVFLLDEMDAGDPNVLLTLNTIENGFISFPDKIVHAHPDFRIVATANPINAHDSYTGRSKLDLSTWDRYEKILIDRDPLLEASLTSQEHYEKITIVRKIFDNHGVSAGLTSRDIMRMYRIEKLGIIDCVFRDIAFKDHPTLHTEYTSHIASLITKKQKASATQSDATSIDQLWDIVQREATTKSAE